jgi:ESCRT-II complex subunit VPS22
MNQKMEFFQKSLEEFAKNHKDDINKDPQFRFHFHQMCLKIGVDPLACKFQTFSPFEASKGFWAKLLGVGDFYYELSVQIIEVCLKTKDQVRLTLFLTTRMED